MISALLPALRSKRRERAAASFDRRRREPSVTASLDSAALTRQEVRHEKGQTLLQLARALAGSAEGLTLDEMAAAIGVGRRTAERMRDAIQELFPQLEVLDDPPTKRFRIPSGLDALFQTPTADELVALNKAAESMRAAGNHSRAGDLDSLEAKLRASMRSSVLRRLVPDMEALLHAETIAVDAGPRPYEDETVLATIRHALKAMRAVRFIYRGGSTPGGWREVTPYGLMFGRTNYLVAAELGSAEPKSWRLDRIGSLEMTDRPAAPPSDFSLTEFAGRSFGIYHGDLHDVVLRVKAEAADDALGWRFHPSQSVERQEDGSVIVRFRASGMLELAWHLFTWRDRIEIVAPEALRTLLLTELETALRAHRPPRRS